MGAPCIQPSYGVSQSFELSCHSSVWCMRWGSSQVNAKREQGMYSGKDSLDSVLLLLCYALLLLYCIVIVFIVNLIIH